MNFYLKAKMIIYYIEELIYDYIEQNIIPKLEDDDAKIEYFENNEYESRNIKQIDIIPIKGKIYYKFLNYDENVSFLIKEKDTDDFMDFLYYKKHIENFKLSSFVALKVEYEKWVQNRKNKSLLRRIKIFFNKKVKIVITKEKKIKKNRYEKINKEKLNEKL